MWACLLFHEATAWATCESAIYVYIVLPLFLAFLGTHDKSSVQTYRGIVLRSGLCVATESIINDTRIEFSHGTDAFSGIPHVVVFALGRERLLHMELAGFVG